MFNVLLLVDLMIVNKNQINTWLFGNFALDTKLFEKQGEKIIVKSFGGSVNFASNALLKFIQGVNCRIYSLGIPPKLLIQKDILFTNELSPVELKQRTQDQYLTHYTLDYTKPRRRLLLEHFPEEKISLPTTTDEKPHIAMITPIYNEVSEELAVQLKNRFSDVFIACDPQGWCRKRDPITNEIIIKEWKPSDSFLNAISVIKLSIEDIRLNYSHEELVSFIQRIHQTDVILIITGGKNGTISFFPNHFIKSLTCYFTPVDEVADVVDTTGAGDVWLAIFSVSYYTTKSIQKALATATIISSLKIQAEGLNFKLMEQEELEKKILIHEKKISEISLEIGIDQIFSK